MTFRFQLETDFDPPETDALGVTYVEFALGYDLDAGIAVVMSVMLVKVDEAYDLRFGIREIDSRMTWKVSAPDYSKEAVKRYIPRDQRAAVAAELQKAVEILINDVRPDYVTMETYYPDLPARARRKYALIELAMIGCNYRMADRFCDETTNKYHWLFVR